MKKKIDEIERESEREEWMREKCERLTLMIEREGIVTRET